VKPVISSLKEFIVAGDNKDNVTVINDVGIIKEFSDNLPNQIEGEQCNTLVDT